MYLPDGCARPIGSFIGVYRRSAGYKRRVGGGTEADVGREELSANVGGGQREDGADQPVLGIYPWV